MSTDLDLIQCTVVRGLYMILAGGNGTCDTVVSGLVFHKNYHSDISDFETARVSKNSMPGCAREYVRNKKHFLHEK